MTSFLATNIEGQTKVLLALFLMLSTMGVLNTQTSRIILGAAVIDDILGLMILAVVSGLALGPVNYLSIFATAALAVAFTAFVVIVGAPVVKRVASRIENLRVSHSRGPNRPGNRRRQ